MAIVNLIANPPEGFPNVINSYGMSGNIKVLVRNIVTNADDAAGSTYSFGYVPANAVGLYSSTINSDDLATTGAPTLDIGLFEVDNNLTNLGFSSDDDALKGGIDVASAQLNRRLFVNTEDATKPFWRLINGVTQEPKGFLEVKATLKDAAITTVGNINICLLYKLP